MAEQVASADAMGPTFPCLAYLKAAWASGAALVTLPWLADYLRMTRWDTVTPHTAYHREVLEVLRAMHLVLSSTLLKVRTRPLGRPQGQSRPLRVF